MIYPKISVIMSVYNGEDYLREAIDSILEQTFDAFEFIIVDDGSTDRTKEIIQSYSDMRIIYIYQENKGLSAALNNGINRAKGKYVARMDDDDISSPNRLMKQFNFMENNDIYVITGTRAEYITEEGDLIYSSPKVDNTKNLKNMLPWMSPFVHSSVMMKTQNLKDVGGYKNTGRYFYQEDILLWIDLSKKGDFYIVNEPLVKFRITRSSNQEKSKSYFQYQMDIVKEYFDKGILNHEKISQIPIEWGKKDSKERESNYYKKIGTTYLKHGNNNKAVKHLIKSYRIKNKYKTLLILILAIVPINYQKILFNR